MFLFNRLSPKWLREWPHPSRAGPSRVSLIGLPAQKGRNVELVLLGGVMHRGRPPMRVEALRRRAASVFRYWLLRTAFRVTSAWPRRPLEVRHGWRGARGAWGFCLLAAAAEANRSEPLHQRHPTLLRMVLIGEFAALRLNFILRRQRQLVDTRHARPAQRCPLRRRRNEGLRRRFGLRRFAGRLLK